MEIEMEMGNGKMKSRFFIKEEREKKKCHMLEKKKVLKKKMCTRHGIRTESF